MRQAHDPLSTQPAVLLPGSICFAVTLHLLCRTDGVGALLPCTRSPLNYQARLGLPLRCQVTGSRSGKPDLRLRLFTIEAGTVEPSRGQQQWRASEVGQQLQGVTHCC